MQIGTSQTQIEQCPLKFLKTYPEIIMIVSFIFPDFNFTKNLKYQEIIMAHLILSSYGYNKNYDTNITEFILMK